MGMQFFMMGGTGRISFLPAIAGTIMPGAVLLLRRL